MPEKKVSRNRNNYSKPDCNRYHIIAGTGGHPVDRHHFHPLFHPGIEREEYTVVSGSLYCHFRKLPAIACRFVLHEKRFGKREVVDMAMLGTTNNPKAGIRIWRQRVHGKLHERAGLVFYQTSRQ